MHRGSGLKEKGHVPGFVVNTVRYKNIYNN